MFSVFFAAPAVFSAPVPAMNYDWFSSVYDFPKNGMKPNELVSVQVDVTVNRRGQIQSCTGHVHSGIPEMGPYVCSRLKQRGVFDPARDPEKRRMYGVYRTFVIIWNNVRPGGNPPKNYRSTDFDIVIPAGAKMKLKSVVIQFAVDEQGNASSCSLVPALGYGLYREKQVVDPSIVASACAALPTKMRIQPAKDETGKAVPSVQNAIIGLNSAQ
jgi:hypothetical protein